VIKNDGWVEVCFLRHYLKNTSQIIRRKFNEYAVLLSQFCQVGLDGHGRTSKWRQAWQVFEHAAHFLPEFHMNKERRASILQNKGSEANISPLSMKALSLPVNFMLTTFNI